MPPHPAVVAVAIFRFFFLFCDKVFCAIHTDVELMILLFHPPRCLTVLLNISVTLGSFGGSPYMSKILGSVSSTSGGAKCLSLNNSRYPVYPFSPWEVEPGTWFSGGVLDSSVKGFGFNSHYQKANKTRIAKPQVKLRSLLGDRCLNRFLNIPHVIPQ